MEESKMRILIATDGSDFSKAAVDKGCDLVSDPSSVDIKIVSVLELPAPIAGEPYVALPSYYQAMESGLQKLAQEYADDAKAAVEKRFPRPAHSIETQVASGKPAQTIVEIASEWNADMIVVGSHGRGFWGRQFIGSVSDSVLHHAPCSVLVVRSDGTGIAEAK
jgi:nucleotide-binding universal stress UspA family protein